MHLKQIYLMPTKKNKRIKQRPIIQMLIVTHYLIRVHNLIKMHTIVMHILKHHKIAKQKQNKLT